MGGDRSSLKSQVGLCGFGVKFLVLRGQVVGRNEWRGWGITQVSVYVFCVGAVIVRYWFIFIVQCVRVLDVFREVCNLFLKEKWYFIKKYENVNIYINKSKKIQFSGSRAGYVCVLGLVLGQFIGDFGGRIRDYGEERGFILIIIGCFLADSVCCQDRFLGCGAENGGGQRVGWEVVRRRGGGYGRGIWEELEGMEEGSGVGRSLGVFQVSIWANSFDRGVGQRVGLQGVIKLSKV